MKSKDRSRLIEWGKTLLIILLALSAIYLLSMAHIFDGAQAGFLGLIASRPTTSEDPAPVRSSSAAVYPVRLAIYQDGQRYGVQYDQATVDTTYTELATLFSEAFSSAAQPRQIRASSWRAALCRTGIYVDYLHAVPLDILSGLSGEGEHNPVLTGSARRVCLAEDETGGVSLFYINESDGSYYASQTTLSLATHLETAVSDISPNGALFAFEVADMETLDPYTLLTSAPQANVYTAGNPLSSDSARVSELLTALTFHAQNATLDPVLGGQYVEGSDFLRLSSHGVVTFHTVGDTAFRFSLPDPSVQGALGYVSALANATVGVWCGQARLQLSGMEQTQDGLVITFQYCLNGSPVALPEEHAARFVVQNGAVTDFSLYLRTYTNTEETSPLLPVLQAAAAMEALNTDGKELVLLYQDSGSETVSAYWAAN